jgi:hypothetical protein
MRNEWLGGLCPSLTEREGIQEITTTGDSEMITSGKTRRFAKSPLLLAAALGLLATTSGCIIDGSDNNGGGTCVPDLYVYWSLVDAFDTPVTCAAAQAGWVRGTVGGINDEVPCPSTSSVGDPLYFPLPQATTYAVNAWVVALDGATEISGLSRTNPPPITVGCSGQTSTPIIKFCVGAGCAPVAYKGELKKK